MRGAGRAAHVARVPAEPGEDRSHQIWEAAMSGRPPPAAEGEQIPLGQKLFDNWPLLLVAGLVVMVVFYTLWGVWEVMSLQPAPLP
jgi:hypothetical protein